RYYVALRFAVGRNVSQFMAANPSTLVQLARVLDAEKEPLLRDLRDGTLRSDIDLSPDLRAVLTRRLRKDPKRAAELSALAEKLGRLYPKDVWPTEGIVINTWAGGSMGPYQRQLPQFCGA